MYGIDVGALLRQPDGGVDFRCKDGSKLSGPGTLIVHVNAPFVPLVMHRIGRRILNQKYLIGYWSWELPRVPDEWRFGQPFVHQIWAQSQFTAEALAPLAEGRPIHVMPHPVVLDRAPAVRSPRPDEATFRVLTMSNMASSFERKNPMAAITAFRSAFGDAPTARLTVKISNASAYPQGRKQVVDAIDRMDNVTFIEDTQTTSEVQALYEGSDTLISLHRSEGFGLSLAEAMIHGLPVVATNWSGNTDFLTSENGFPVAFEFVAARDPQGTYDHPDMTWAEPDTNDAAQILRSLYDDPELRRRTGQEAMAYAFKTWNAERYAARVRHILDQRS